jgi:hypothetical protein
MLLPSSVAASRDTADTSPRQVWTNASRSRRTGSSFPAKTDRFMSALATWCSVCRSRAASWRDHHELSHNAGYACEHPESPRSSSIERYP